MDSRKRNRRAVVCNVCRRRKVRCDRGKPACGACKKSNVSHLCIYEERGSGSHGGGDDDPKEDSYGFGIFSIRSNNGNNNSHNQLQYEQQKRLKEQQLQFRMEFQAQQQHQQNLQSQMSAKYGITGANTPVPYTINSHTHNHNNNNHNNNIIPSVPAASYYQQNLAQEVEFYKSRVAQLEALLQQQSHQPQPQQLLQLQPQQNIPYSLPQSQFKGDETDIDPTLFEDDEIVTIYQDSVPNSQYIGMEPNGLFSFGSYVRKDSFQANLYANILSYSEKLNKDQQQQNIHKFKSNKFEQLLQNENFKIEEFFKNETTNLSNIIKQINKILPNKKHVWLILDKFFTTLYEPYFSIINEQEYLTDLIKIIGNRELLDVKIELRLNLNNTSDLVNLLYLLIIIKIVQLSLLTTNKLDKQNNYLLKNSQTSQDYDYYIELITIIVSSFKIDQLSELRINLLNAFLSILTFNGKKPSSFHANQALALNLNNKNKIGEDSNLAQLWYHTYFLYIFLSSRQGLPILLGQEFFNLSHILRPNLGEGFNQNVNEYNDQQMIFYGHLTKIMNLLNDHSSRGVPLKSLEDLILKLDDIMETNFQSFQSYKNSIASGGHPEKIMKTFHDLTYKYMLQHIYGFILLNFERKKLDNHEKMLKYIEKFSNSILISVEDCFDILKNYDLYFHSGYEFLLYPSILILLERSLRFLINFYLRSHFLGEPSLAILKGICNILEELDGFPVLKRYYEYWKLSKRYRILLFFFKNDYFNIGDLKLFNSKVSLQNVKRELLFELSTNYAEFNREQVEKIETNFNKINEKFDTRYSNITSSKELFQSLQFEEPEFDIKLLFS